MIAELKPYAAYKDSGENWIGRIPTHWDLRPAFGAFVPNREKNTGMKEKTVLSLSYGRIVVKPPEKLRGLVPESFETYQIVNPGDIVIRTTDLQNDHTSLRVAMVHNRGIITSAYLALHAMPGVQPEFGYQILNVWDLTKAIYGFGSGLRQGLDFAHFKRMTVAVPPPEEQAVIVRFLDHANGRLERAIRAKRKVIALLNEQKQAIIHRAVTRGLDPAAPTKPSSLPWLDTIPAHWEVRRASSLAEFLTGKAHEPFIDAAGRYICVNARFVSTSGDTCKTCTQNLSPAQTGDVLMVMSDLPNGRALARAYLVRDQRQYAVNQRVCILRPKTIEPGYLAYFANRNPALLRHDDGSNQTHLSNGDFKTLPVLCPPRPEQVAIVKMLDSEVAQIDSSIARLEREIALLREYRTRLVADVVTGQLDVRPATTRLPIENNSTLETDLTAEPDFEEANADT